MSIINTAVSSLASQPYFSAYALSLAKVGGGREGKIRLPGFCDSVVCAECLPRTCT